MATIVAGISIIVALNQVSRTEELGPHPRNRQPRSLLPKSANRSVVFQIRFICGNSRGGLSVSIENTAKFEGGMLRCDSIGSDMSVTEGKHANSNPTNRTHVAHKTEALQSAPMIASSF